MGKYKAPFSTSLTASTWIVSALLGISGMATLTLGLWFIALPIVGILVFTMLFTVRAYSIASNALLIQRLFWVTRLDLSGLRSAYADPNAMNKSIRTGGADGLFATLGYYNNKALGDYRAFVTNPKNAVVLNFNSETVVVSPGEPEAFVIELLHDRGGH